LLPCGGHLGYAIGTKITNLVEDHPVIISIMLQLHRLSSFWQEDFQSFNQSEQIIGPGSHVGFPICTKITNLVKDLQMNISAKFGPNLFSGFREEDENMKSLQTRTTTTDAKWWQNFTWPFGPGELIILTAKKDQFKPTTGPGFTLAYIMVIFVFKVLKWVVAVCFACYWIGDHQFTTFFFILNYC
jgi:hypothetical protein